MPSFSISPEDQVRLRHILDAALEIRQYVQCSRREDRDQERKLVHSLGRLLEIIGDAANQVSKELRDQIPEIPWIMMVGMRNRLVHACFAISLNIAWSTSTEDIPPRIAALKGLLHEY
jgi:uncharacterized protein with HEPN domain